MKDNTSLWIVVVLFVIGVIGLVVYTGLPGNEVAETPEVGDQAPGDIEYVDEEISENPDTVVTTDDIVDDPTAYVGSEVTVRAEVEEWINSRSIVLDAPGIIEDDLLVITDEPAFIFEDPEIFGDAIWQVEGTVELFTFTDAQEALTLDVEPEAYEDYEGEPFIRAESVTLFEE